MEVEEAERERSCIIGIRWRMPSFSNDTGVVRNTPRHARRHLSFWPPHPEGYDAAELGGLELPVEPVSGSAARVQFEVPGEVVVCCELYRASLRPFTSP